MAGNNKLLDQNFRHYREVIDGTFKKLYQLTSDIKNEKMANTVDDIRSKLNEPFLFVIVGEVKVGKSSFVNALLESDKEVCKVAPDPCTDTIQQIVYAEKESVIPINDYLKKITLPVDILKEIAIVDTPGTNTIHKHHTEITERFIPISDLIIFVFEAKNPYRESAWNFFDYISKEWRKKVIFVMQQSDLMEPDDLEVNRKGVIRYAEQRGIHNPKVFSVSAKREQQGNTAESGFGDVRNFIRETVTGGNNIRLKVRSVLSTSKNIMDSIWSGVEIREKQLAQDGTFRDKVNSLLAETGDKTQKQSDDLVEELVEEYDIVMGDIQKEFHQGLGVFSLMKRSVKSIFSKDESMEEWIQSIAERVEDELKPALDEKLREGLRQFAESIKQMAEIIEKEIRKNEAVLKDGGNTQLFGDIANKRQEKLEKLQANLTNFIDDTEDFLSTDILDRSSSLVPNIATGSGLAVLGGVLSAVTGTMAIEVTGGILALVGLSVVAIFTPLQTRKIKKEFQAEIDRGRENLREETTEILKRYVDEIRLKIDNNFLEFDSWMKEEQDSLQDLKDRYTGIEQEFRKLKQDLEI